jgi:glycosyltransferase involved in cell wall biosynthesis
MMTTPIKPLLSIIIATKNRVPYCINSIETILSNANDDFELIVQDNTDTTELKDYVSVNITDQRFVYRYTPPPFSSIDNFNAALELATGEYVCLIGDDDGVCSSIFEVVKWAKSNHIDSVCPKVFVDFYWPDAFYSGSKGYVFIPYYSNSIYSLNPQSRIEDVLEDGIIDYMKFNLPKLYHGLVKKSCFDAIKALNGYYIGGLSPDIYTAVSLSFFVKNHVVLDFPITISGACKVSTTVAGLNGGHSGLLSEAPHFRDRGFYVWDKRIPKYYSVQTIWAESAMSALVDLNLVVNFEAFNLARMVAKSISITPKHIKLFLNETHKILEENQFNPTVFYIKFSINLVSIVFFKYLKKFLNKLKSKLFFRTQRIDSVSSIGEATRKVEFLIEKDLNLNFDSILTLKK